MLFLADENIPLYSVQKLRSSGLDIISISENSPGIPDSDVLKLSEQQNRILLTFDLDFGELIFKSNVRATQGIILFRFIPASPLELADLFLSILLANNFNFQGNFTVIERDFVRQRPLF